MVRVSWRNLALGPFLGLSITSLGMTQPPKSSSCPSLLNHSFRTLQGQPQNLCQYKQKVLLIVNTASFCGYTPQYKDLQTLHQKYQSRGFAVLGFPSHSFRQEPGSTADIQKLCKETYKVGFPMFDKSLVRGSQVNPLHAQLTRMTGHTPLWNFHKYLVNRDGTKALSFDSHVSPLAPQLTQALEKWLL